MPVTQLSITLLTQNSLAILTGYISRTLMIDLIRLIFFLLVCILPMCPDGTVISDFIYSAIIAQNNSVTIIVYMKLNFYSIVLYRMGYLKYRVADYKSSFTCEVN